MTEKDLVSEPWVSQFLLWDQCQTQKGTQKFG
jgi:hypothetical protein